MDCEQAKKLVREGRAAEARTHTAGCADCRAFAESFADVAALLGRGDSAPDVSGDLLERTLAMARRELAEDATAREAAMRPRLAAAACLAVVFAPLLIFLNYTIAMGAHDFLAEQLTPAAGDVFLAFYAAGAASIIGLAYGALPLIFGAARNALHDFATIGGEPA